MPFHRSLAAQACPIPVIIALHFRRWVVFRTPKASNGRVTVAPTPPRLLSAPAGIICKQGRRDDQIMTPGSSAVPLSKKLWEPNDSRGRKGALFLDTPGQPRQHGPQTAWPSLNARRRSHGHTPTRCSPRLLISATTAPGGSEAPVWYVCSCTKVETGAPPGP